MTTPEEAARRIIEPPKKERPTIEELEAILAAPDGPPVTINPDGSIGVGESDATIVARALLAAEARIRVLEEALTDAANILENLANHVSQPALAICLVGDAKRFRAALAKPEE
jgi:hypothetical protein